MTLKNNLGYCQECHYKKSLNSRNLCSDCVYKENHEGKSKFEVQKDRLKDKGNLPNKVIYTLSKSPFKGARIAKNSINKDIILKDEEVYEKVFFSKSNFCEECGKELPNVFRDNEGKIICRFQYSHILGKGAFPEFRHSVWNFNRLCFECHQIWDFGDKESMSIFIKNKITILENTGRDLL